MVDGTKGAEERIVGLMLGPVAASRRRRATIAAAASAAASPVRTHPRTGAASRGAAARRVSPGPGRAAAGTKLQDVSFELSAGEVLGVVALEGQGQEELFEVLAGIPSPGRR